MGHSAGEAHDQDKLSFEFPLLSCGVSRVHRYGNLNIVTDGTISDLKTVVEKASAK